MPAIVANSKLALNFQSKVDGAKEIRDYGATGHIITQYVTAGLSTAVAAPTGFGNSVIYFDGNSDYLTAPDHSDWVLGNAFTIEARCYFAVNNASQYIGGQYQAGKYWYFVYHSTGTFYVAFYDGGTTLNFHCAAFTPTINTWYHIALIRINGDNSADAWLITVDGVPYALTLDAGAWNASFPDVASTYQISYNGDGSGGWFNGYMTEYRVSNVARWSADFSASLPTAPYGSDANTKLLIHANSYDCCPTPKIPTFVGTAQIDTAVSKFGESSLLLDGNSDYVSFPASTDWNLGSAGSGDFTLKAFIRFNSVPGGNQAVISTAASANGWIFGTSSTGLYRYDGVNEGSLAYTWVVDTWYHICLVRSGSTITAYVNGSSIGTFTDGDWNNDSQALAIGAQTGGATLFNGFIDGVSIIKGTAVAPETGGDSTPPYAQYYSRKAGAAPANDDDLTTIFTTEEEYDVLAADEITVDQNASATNSAIFQFKDVIPGSNVATLTWTGQTDVAGSSATIYLQAYNRDTTAWVTVDTDTTVAANTDFTLTGVLTDLTDYLDTDGLISCRVYQTAI